jgi:hypothetical protein
MRSPHEPPEWWLRALGVGLVLAALAALMVWALSE